ncbi:hypothetical protein B0H67DRAFT_480349 [Lasiosphaeris hirsuta]|uniref:Uncharacterized protein n=1 Tax=Lasiosphaeris hirsuta TaxID=260670 RepID=A0AA40B1G8_9PEZI|nr:hypothetical protein B0H67DRAFT_480349 [Lasiosphaeris hirsuta]
MARIFITGSSDALGLGSRTAKRLIAQGHQVVLHARNAQRATDAAAACPGSAGVLIGDLSQLGEVKALAAQADALGPYDAVVHNAGLYTGPDTFAVNTLAPYVLTSLMRRPRRLVYVSSGLHYGGRAHLGGEGEGKGEGEGDVVRSSYADTKLHDVVLAKAFARRWGYRHGVEAFSVDPGWVPTKMGGEGATGSMEEALDTFVMVTLGTGLRNGGYFAGSHEKTPLAVAEDVGLQDRLLAELARISGVTVPE